MGRDIVRHLIHDALRSFVLDRGMIHANQISFIRSIGGLLVER